jgi:chromosome segregation protein
VHFQRLRLSGFKSFIDPTDFRIEPGLTGIVGPNGCGKSNLLEALRWVMGANSAKAMRAEGMDDVIFAGNTGRASRNHAEVVLTIDNADRRAPAQFNDHAVLEVGRRIDRGEGSTYRINGREVRARDVQLLFADASTGANSPSLVRQGQISELIGAKPQNRRMILEEAAGVSGLHSRRHEAELRLRAAEANVARLEDLIQELDATAGRLRREARQAEKYKRLSAEIRTLQSAALYARWAEARDVLERIEAEAGQSALAVEETARAAAAATVEAAKAEEAIKPLRDEEMAAAAILHKLAVEKDRLEHEAQRIEAEAGRLAAAIARIDADRGREGQIVEDAKAALARIDADVASIQAEIAAAPERGPELEALWRAAEEVRARADGEVERLGAEAAAEAARREALAQRLADAHSRLGRTQRAFDMAKADRAALGPTENPAAVEAKARFDTAVAALTAARLALEAAEADQAKAAAAEVKAREAARKAEDQLGRMKTEARGLAQLVQPKQKDGFKPALDQVAPERGLEAALAAALGDDLDAALDPRAPAFWRGAKAQAHNWPQGVASLAEVVKAPPELAARLALTGLVARADGERLQKALPPGGRLVSREGDLWRWDGFTSRAEAPRPAAVRLAQKARLEEVESEIDALAPAAAAAAQALAAAQSDLRAREEALRAARRAPQEADRAVGQARDAMDRFGQEAARRDARAQSLDETIARFDAERIEAEAALAQAQADIEAAPAADDRGPALAAARVAAGQAREASASARADYDQERRDRETRQRRLEALERDRTDWRRRAEGAAKRLEELAGERARTDAEIAASREAPGELEARKQTLLDELQTAEARRAKAGDAFAAGETLRTGADRAARLADQRAGEARELRAGLAARLDGARERLQEMAAAVRETARMEPDALATTLAEQAANLPKDIQGVEQRLYTLERERELIGAVNLRAEEEAAEYGERLDTLRDERADLTGAVAKLRQGIEELNSEGRERLIAAFDVINEHFKALFQALFDGGQAELRLIESDDPLEAGLEIYACPPGKRLAAMSLMSGGEQALTATALIFGVFLANPAPICVLDEVDAPLDDANVDRFCNLLNEMRRRTQTRFIAITHNPVTMSRMDRLFGVTMPERGVSQLVSVDLHQAEAMAAQ